MNNHLSKRDTIAIENRRVKSMNHRTRSNFATFSTVGELPGHEQHATPSMLIRQVFALFENQPDLPGVIIMDEQNPGVLTRSQLYEWLSRPFGTELFLNRPVSYLLKNAALSNFSIPADTRIDDAVQIALQRSERSLYEPILITGTNNRQFLVDFHVLLHAQSELLAQANHFIHQQMETGRNLSHIFDINDLLSQILEYMEKQVPYHQATILMINKEAPGKSLPVTRLANGLEIAVPELALDPRAFEYLYHSRQSLLISEMYKSSEWLMEPCDEILSWIGFPLLYADHVICILSLARTRRKAGQSGSESILNSPFTTNDIDLITGLSSTFTAAIRNAQLYSELRSLSVTDPLTGILNRRGFFDLAQKTIENLSTTSSVTVMIMDLDYFKRINDQYGHRIGDLVLRCVAKECHNQLRHKDLIGRYGGEEFVILLPNTNQADSYKTAERLRRHVEQLEIQTGRGLARVTISIGGLCVSPSNVTLDQALQHADELLYDAKRQGRNRVLIQNALHTSFIEQTTSNTALPELAFSETDHTQQPNHYQGLENDCVIGWMRALELREKDSEGHAQRVAEITVQLARLFIQDKKRLKNIYWGALLHDIGKIAIPDHILFKPGNLDSGEWKIMQRHPEYAQHILAPVGFLKDALAIPLNHHERWDGSGYPHGMRGEHIPLEARLFAIIDVWDALSSDRCYRPAWAPHKVQAYLLEQAGVLFDPDLVNRVLEHLQGNIHPTSGYNEDNPFTKEMPCPLPPFPCSVSTLEYPSWRQPLTGGKLA